MLAAFVACECIISLQCFSVASSGSSSGQQLLCILYVHLRKSSWLCLARCSVCWRVCFLVFPLPPLPIQGSKGLSSIVFFSIELTVQCDGCLIWGLGWQAGLMAGLWVGHAYGVFHRVWVVGFSPQVLEHATSICDTGDKCIFIY